MVRHPPRPGSSANPPVVELTPRQFEVINELAHDGATNAEIAERLGMSLHNVGVRMGEIMSRTGYHDRTALAVALIRRRILVRSINRSNNPFRKEDS